MIPLEYTTIVVLPTVHEFLAAPDDIRLAYTSCILSYHVIDHIAHAERSDTQAVRSVLAGDCGAALQIVRGLCNGTKHAERRGGVNPGDEKHVPVAAYDTPGAGWDEARWDVPGLMVEHAGTSMFIDEAVKTLLLSLYKLYPKHLGSVSPGF